MQEYGLNVLTKTGRDVRVLADGNYARFKSGGISLDSAVIPTASGSPVTLADDTVVAVGQAYLRYGQILTRNTTSGLYGPYDSAASDGRQTLTRGSCFILNKTWVDNPTGSVFLLPFQGGSHPAVFDGGRVVLARLIQSGVSAHSLILGPTFAEFIAAFPEVSFVGN